MHKANISSQPPAPGRALWTSVAICLVFAIAGNLLIGEPLSTWYAAR